MKGARHRGSTLTRVSLSQIDNWPRVAPPVYLSCLMSVMLYGLFCARSIDVPAVLASFYEYNGFLNAIAFYVLLFTLAWPVYLGFTHLMPSMDVPCTLDDNLMGMV